MSNPATSPTLQERHLEAIAKQQSWNRYVDDNGFRQEDYDVNIDAAASACAAISIEFARQAFEAGRRKSFYLGEPNGNFYPTFEDFLQSLNTKS